MTLIMSHVSCVKSAWDTVRVFAQHLSFGTFEVNFLNKMKIFNESSFEKLPLTHDNAKAGIRNCQKELTRTLKCKEPKRSGNCVLRRPLAKIRKGAKMHFSEQSWFLELFFCFANQHFTTTPDFPPRPWPTNVS
jgi:hypothetical protein